MIEIPKRRLKPDEAFGWAAPMIGFRMISDRGDAEEELTGGLWGPAPPWRSGPASWVIHSGQVLLVPLVTRRHRVGRVSGRGWLAEKGGRYADPGERYSCPATRRALADALERHTLRIRFRPIPVEPLDPWLMEFLSDPLLFCLSAGGGSEMMHT